MCHVFSPKSKLAPMHCREVCRPEYPSSTSDEPPPPPPNQHTKSSNPWLQWQNYLHGLTPPATLPPSLFYRRKQNLKLLHTKILYVFIFKFYFMSHLFLILWYSFPTPQPQDSLCFLNQSREKDHSHEYFFADLHFLSPFALLIERFFSGDCTMKLLLPRIVDNLNLQFRFFGFILPDRVFAKSNASACKWTNQSWHDARGHWPSLACELHFSVFFLNFFWLLDLFWNNGFVQSFLVFFCGNRYKWLFKTCTMRPYQKCITLTKLSLEDVKIFLQKSVHSGDC